MMLFEHIKKNDAAAVEKILASHNDMWVDKFGYSALHIAISKGSDAIAIMVIESGIDLNLKDSKGQTALHYCAFYNKLAIAKIIIERGGDLNISDNYGNQPLWTAVINDRGFGSRLEMIKCFIDNGANSDYVNNVNKTPLQVVEELGYTQAFEILKRGSN